AKPLQHQFEFCLRVASVATGFAFAAYTAGRAYPHAHAITIAVAARSPFHRCGPGRSNWSQCQLIFSGRHPMNLHSVMILTVGLLLAADDPKQEAINKEVDKLQGEWQLVSLERDGKMIPSEHFKNAGIIFEGNQRTVKEGGAVRQRSTLTLDPSTSPKTIEY